MARHIASHNLFIYFLGDGEGNSFMGKDTEWKAADYMHMHVGKVIAVEMLCSIFWMGGGSANTS